MAWALIAYPLLLSTNTVKVVALKASLVTSLRCACAAEFLTMICILNEWECTEAALLRSMLDHSRLRLRQAKKVNEAAVYDGAQRIHWRHKGVLYTHLVDKTSGPSRFASAT